MCVVSSSSRRVMGRVTRPLNADATSRPDCEQLGRRQGRIWQSSCRRQTSASWSRRLNDARFTLILGSWGIGNAGHGNP